MEENYNKMNCLFLSAKSAPVTHINYHYTQFAEVIDYIKRNVTKNIISKDLDVEDFNLEETLIEENISKVVMYVNYENALMSFALAEEIKKKNPQISIMAYGNVPTLHYNLFIDSKFDAIYKSGDFEKGIENFIRYYEKEEELPEDTGNKEAELKINTNNLGRLKNLYLNATGRLYYLNNDEYISDENWGITDENYALLYDQVKNKNRYVINLSRGCPFDCRHCLVQKTEGHVERRRGLKNLKKNLVEISKKYKHIKFWAANFTLDEKYVLDLCEMMIDSFPELTWECATRLDLLKNKEMISKMSEAGCTQISLGIESLRNKDLIANKNFSKKLIEERIALLQDNDINVKACVMIGIENQTKEDIYETFQFLLDRNVALRPTIYTPYQEIGDNIKLEELHMYNRKTYNKNKIEGLSNEELFLLIKHPEKYTEIIDISKGEKQKETFEIEL